MHPAIKMSADFLISEGNPVEYRMRRYTRDFYVNPEAFLALMHNVMDVRKVTGMEEPPGDFIWDNTPEDDVPNPFADLEAKI